MIKRIAFAVLLVAASGAAQTVNCVVAIVNGEIITLLDVRIAAEFGLGRAGAEDEGSDQKMAALDALIDRKVVLDMAREARGVDAAVLAAALDGLRRRIGAAAFSAKLGKFGLTEKDLEPYLRDRILCERAMDMRFSQTIPVPVTEVERHYRDIYVPEQTRLGLAAEPLARVADLIEARLRDERRTKQMADWVRDLRKRADVQVKMDCLKS